MFRNRSASSHSFAMVPRADIPRASFNITTTHKTTFDSGWLIPVFCEEVLPGDSWRLKMTAFARLATPIFPVMDNLYLDSFFFFIPNRILWANWKRFMGEQLSPGDSISYVVPKITSPAGGFAVGSIYDYLGLPTVGQVVAGNSITINALPLRAYALVFNEWFRDQNLYGPMNRYADDGPDPAADYFIIRRGKRHDYFTSCLPWPQKGNASVTIPLGSTAPVISNNTSPQITTLSSVGAHTTRIAAGTGAIGQSLTVANQAIPATVGASIVWGPNTGMVADLSQATAATINQLRQSFQIQKLLERDARGGTRYTEIVRSHFGVISPDARLQRPEYLGGGTAPIVLNPIAQTSATNVDGSDTPLGNLAAIGTMVAHNHGFSQSFTEHGYILGLVSVRADLTYQQGLRRHWSRNTRYDFYFPAFAHLGEQAVLSKEIFCNGDSVQDALVFGYQERWAEYRYIPGQVTGLFRSTSVGTLDAWHLAQRFSARPVLGSTFIAETPPLERVLAVGASAGGAQLIFDSAFDIKVARPMPLYSVPGLIDHF